MAICLALSAAALSAEQATHGPEIHIRRASGPIKVDADLSDPGWKDAVKIETWYETNPGDNLEPKVKSVGYLAYDDKFLYAAFEFFDPEPSKIRAPIPIATTSRGRRTTAASSSTRETTERPASCC